MNETQMVKSPSTGTGLLSAFIPLLATMRRGGGGIQRLRTKKQPLPPVEPPDVVQLQNPRRKHGADGVGTKHAKEEDGNPLGQLALCVPRLEGVDGSRNVARLAKAKDDARSKKAGTVPEEDL